MIETCPAISEHLQLTTRGFSTVQLVRYHGNVGELTRRKSQFSQVETKARWLSSNSSSSWNARARDNIVSAAFSFIYM